MSAPTPNDPHSASASTGDEPSSRPRTKNRLRHTFILVFSIGLFGAILWFGGLQGWRSLIAGDPWLYFLAFLLSGLVPLLSAWRLRTLVRAATNEEVSTLRRFFHINMTAIALGLFLPRNAAMLGGKAAYLRTLGVPVFRGSWGIMMEYLVDLTFLSLLVLPGLLVLLGGTGPIVYCAVTLAGVLFLLGGILWAKRRDWRALLGRLIRRIPWLSSRLPISEDGIVPGPVKGVALLAVTVIIHLSMAFRAYVVALAIGLEPSWLIFLAAYPLTQLGLALAVAPGALGTLDASWLGLLILGGMSKPDALSFTVALRASIVVFPVVWYGISVLLTAAWPDAPLDSVSTPVRQAEDTL